jgi:predicted phage terminase large subunit-like protein
MPLSQRDFEKQYGDLIKRIRQETTSFPNDSITKREARKKRAKADKFFFAVTYFPHYIDVKEEYRDCWKDPDGKYDWVDAGFAPFHKELFEFSDRLLVLSIIAGFRESAKDTLLAKIDVAHKIVCEERWFIPVISKTQDIAESKVIPVRLEFEENRRLKSDFGNLKGNMEWESGSFITKSGRKMKGYGREQSLRGQENFGHRLDHIILNDISDPTKPDSPALVQKYVDSVKQDVLKSVNSPRWSALLLCNWTIKGDVVDELIAGKNTAHYEKHIYRALVPNELESKSDLQIAQQCRSAGFSDQAKSAWEYRHPTLRLLQEKKNDPDVFEPEMMMHPRNRKDQRFKDNYFRYHTKQDLAGRTYVNYTFVDPSAKEAADYKAVVTVGLGLNAKGDIHIPVRRASIQQQSIDEMILETYRQKNLFNSKVVGVETNGFQILLKPEYMRLQKKHGLLPFQEIEHKGESKESRIERIVPFVKEGTVSFDLDDPDQEILIRQLKAFPNAGQVAQGGLGDDGPDSLAGCLELIEKYPHAGEVTYKSLRKREAVFEGGTY